MRGGTASLIAGEPGLRQLDVSVNPYDDYPADEQSRLIMVRPGPHYLPAIRQALQEEDRRGESFGLCLYNAGMDPCESCSVGGRAEITSEMLAERERPVFEWCRRRRLPVAFALAGGYVGPGLDERGLVALHRLTLSAASRAGRASSRD